MANRKPTVHIIINQKDILVFLSFGSPGINYK